jgi:hypothetical protein
MATLKVLAVIVVLGLLLNIGHAAEEKPKRGPKVTNKVYFDVAVDGVDAGGLEGIAAHPETARNHVQDRGKDPIL